MTSDIAPGATAVESPGRAALASTERRWRFRRLASVSVRAAAWCLPSVMAALALDRRGMAWFWAVVPLVAWGLLVYRWLRHALRRPDPRQIALALDRHREAHEFSSELLLVDEGELPPLARLQRRRVERRLQQQLEHGDSPGRAAPPQSGLAATTRWVAGALLAAFAVGWFGARPRAGSAVESPIDPVAVSSRESLGVRSASVKVEPPAYTRVAPWTAEGLVAVVPEGSRLSWQVEAEGEPDEATLLFDEVDRRRLAPPAASPEDRGRLVAEEVVRQSRLVRLELHRGDETVSGPLERLEVERDRPPGIVVLEPAPYLELAADELGPLTFRVEVSDDYGAGAVELVATVASGYGELVEFRERRIDFDRRLAVETGETTGRRVERLTRVLDLEALGVAPGVDLFVYVEAFDRREPEPNRVRSATHIVRVPGGGPQSVGLSARLPVLRVPEFFRSQRQIILDTERLLEQEGKLTAEEFRRRSESLGFDQRALRLRYGGLLGEEFVSGAPAGEGGEAEEHGEHEGELMRLDEMEGGVAGETEEALEQLAPGLVHEHDSAEIATFFDSEIKDQLKAALAEMWGAEGSLRGVEPRRALPYEYRALSLLKDVQQRSRLYVQKIGFEPPELFPRERRLTGELDEIRTARRTGSSSSDPSGVELAQAFRDLGAWLDSGEAPAGLQTSGEAAARALAARAREDAGVDLAGLVALRQVLDGLSTGVAVAPEHLESARRALWGQMPQPSRVPSIDRRARGGLGAPLSDKPGSDEPGSDELGSTELGGDRQ